MKPVSIQRFSQFMLASVAISLVQVWNGFDRMRDAVAANPEVTAFSDEALIAGTVIAIGVMLLLWFLIAMRASSVARWVLVALTGLGLLSLPGMLTRAKGDGAIDLALAIGAAGLQIAAVGMLFTREARDWLAGRLHPDAAHGSPGGDADGAG
jgi:hypothetical protein